MKKFLLHSALFLIPVVVALVALECVLRQMPNPYKSKCEWMNQHASTVQTLVLGNSHTFYGVQPQYLDGEAYNLANVSQTLREDCYLLTHWADDYKQLQTVIVPIAYCTLFEDLEHSTESYRCRYYSIYMDCDLYPCLPQYHLEVADISSAMAKLKRDTGVDWDQWGWGTAYKLANKSQQQWDNHTEAIASAQRHTIDDWSLLDANVQLLDSIATFCEQRHIRLVLITTPCWSDYYTRLDHKQLQQMYATLRTLQQQHPTVQYLDYMRDPRFTADDFYDSNHLSNRGSQKFTTLLNDTIK